MEKQFQEDMPVQSSDYCNYPYRFGLSAIRNPEILRTFFEQHPLHDTRSRLKRWLEDTLRLNGEKGAEHVMTYRHVEKVMEAAYAVYRLHTPKPDHENRGDYSGSSHKEDSLKDRDAEDILSPLSTIDRGSPVNETISAASFNNRRIPLSDSGEILLKDSKALQRILDMIVELIGPEKIFLLGTDEHCQPDGKILYDLLIAVPGSAGRPYNEYEAIIEHISMRIHPVTALFLKAGDLHRMLSAGHIYFSRICCSSNLIYDEGGQPMPMPETIPVENIITKAKEDFHHGFHKAQAFLEGAQHYSERREKELAAFMLQQAMEHTYRAMLTGLTAQSVVSHNLRLLMRRCQRCAPELNKVFPGDNEKERQLLCLLQKAYVNTRYKNDYKISEYELMILLDRMNHLHIVAKMIFDLKITEAADALSDSSNPM